MTRAHAERRLATGLVAAVGFFAAAFLAGRSHTRIDAYPAPSAELSRYAIAVIDAALADEPAPRATAAVRSYTPPGPFVVLAWDSHQVVARHVVSGDLEYAMRRAGAALRADSDARARAAAGHLRVSIEVGLGRGRLARTPITPFTLVPLIEGVHARANGRDVYLTPLELAAEDAYRGVMQAGTPEYTVGVDVRAIFRRLTVGLDADALGLRDMERVRFARISRTPYPSPVTLDERTLTRAAMEAGEFLYRFQNEEGLYTYIYDPLTGRISNAGFNITRHAGTAYFMAQLARVTGNEEARVSARTAVRFLTSRFMNRCGSPSRLCVAQRPRVEIGPSALLAVACAELLRIGPDEELAQVLRGLTAFLRSQQRPDGELMHVFDLARNEPIDEQLPYFSGEAALALLMAYRVQHDPRDLEVAKRLLAGVVATWSFPFDAYYYGEEHWTCIAASEGRKHFRDDALDGLCRRWLAYSDRLQYREGETPWPLEGTYGAGPMLVPNLTPSGSRGEAFVATYVLLRERGEDTSLARAHVSRTLRGLLRYRFGPGPTELMSDPRSARGGMPASPSNLVVRNDYVQHAGSAWLRYVEVLREERAARRRTPNSTTAPRTE